MPGYLFSREGLVPCKDQRILQIVACPKLSGENKNVLAYNYDVVTVNIYYMFTATTYTKKSDQCFVVICG
jgi:hypothetical protein